MKSLVFKNDYHKGDLHQVRTFLTNIAKNNPGWRFYRCHAKERTLHDVPMTYIKKSQLEERLPGIPVEDVWIGRDNHKWRKLYGHSPDGYKAIFKIICNKYNFVCDVSDYIPVINYSMFSIQKVDAFLSTIQKPCVIVSNGKVLSGQIHNFAMDPIIEKLKPFFTVVTTRDRKRKGEYYTGNIIQRGAEDLAEISYLSTKSYAIVGRSSGPFIFSLVKENYNSKLKMICIAKKKRGSYWDNAQNDYWIPATDSMDVMITKISHILGI